jgi:hypothetical protein
MTISKKYLLSKQHVGNLRWAVVDDDGTCAWLYITEPDSEKPVSDCFLYNRIPVIEDEIVNYYVSRGIQPPISKKFASQSALIKNIDEGQVQINWSNDGSLVTVNIFGNKWATIFIGEKLGSSRGIENEGPFGYPLTEKTETHIT